MKVLGVIPARLNSQRLSKKLIKNLLGRPLIQWTWQAARQAKKIDRLVIACDSPELAEVCEKFGAEVIITSSEHNSGTQRITEVIKKIEAEVAINIQADEPLMSPEVIDSLAEDILSDDNILVDTVIRKMDDESLIVDPSIVKAIIDKDSFAIYFSRAAIPFVRDKNTKTIFYKHLGIYAYRTKFLKLLEGFGPSYLEEAEKLEQLKILENGYKIKTITTEFDTIGVDTEGDFMKVENILKGRSGGK